MDIINKEPIRSEYKKLKTVLLHKPDSRIVSYNKPSKVLHISKINYNILEKEYKQIITEYKKIGVNVHLIPSKHINENNVNALFNMMYTRDLFFMTPKGAILSNMANSIRSGEIKYASKTLKKIGIPIIKKVSYGGTFEGADALWLNQNLVIVGVGKRTNYKGFLQVKQALKKQKIDCIKISMPHGDIPQHLLGVLQFVDSDLALLRTDLVEKEVIDILLKNNIKIISIHETEEVRKKQAMNIVTIAPRKIFMSSGCLKTKEIYKKNGITVVAEIKISQLINGSGGLACATAIIARK